MKALIIGGGICGPVTAMALQRAGIDAVIVESREQALGDAGGYLTVATNGLDALRAIDADRAVMERGFPTRDIVMFNGAGKRLGRVPMGSTRDERLVSHTIKRAHLHRALHEEAAACEWSAVGGWRTFTRSSEAACAPSSPTAQARPRIC